MDRRRFLGALALATTTGCVGSDGGADPSATVGPSPARSDDGSQLTATGTATAPSSLPEPAGRDRPWRGVSLSPRSFEGAAFATFVEQAVVAGSALRWAGDWAELADPSGAPAVVADLADQHGLAAVIDTGVFSADERALFRPLTTATRRSYVESAASFAAEHRPAYLGLGVEVNLHREADPASFEAYVELFAEAASAVADASPETALSVTFQYEQLQGLRGGLFGGENDPASARWALLDRFPDADVVGLTTYPGLLFRDPAEVPDGYFEPVADRTDRPLAITETGWPAETIAEGWASDAAEQAAYVERLFGLVDGLDLELLLWLWLYDQATAVAAFRGMGLRRADGSPRPAWDAWVGGDA